MRTLLFTLLFAFALPVLRAQVAATQPFSVALRRAVALEAGATATDIPHHVHYDLKLYDVHHHRMTGTWDIWRDPQHYVRTDIVAGTFHYTHIEDLIRKVQWRHFNERMPLKVYDLRQDYAQPVYAVSLFAHARPVEKVHFEQVDGSPFDCTGTVGESRICLDPIAHVLAFTQIFQQTMTWEDWQPVGIHSIPRRFSIYDDGDLIVQASGEATEVNTFPTGLFVIPPGEPDMGEPERDDSAPHRVVSFEPVQDPQPLYGNVLVTAEVRPNGHVKKVKVVDSDDWQIVGDAKDFVKHFVLEPQRQNGVNVGFFDFYYVRCWPRVAAIYAKEPEGREKARSARVPPRAPAPPQPGSPSAETSPPSPQ